MDILTQLKNKGIKLTKHKIQVLQLFNVHRHLDALQIFKLLKDQYVNISLATVYRILTKLEQNSIIQKHNFNNEQSTYELMHPDEHHDHMICLSCKQVTEFVNHKIEELQQTIANKEQFEIVSHTLNLYGICRKCQQVNEAE
jgi:Fur family ferric uptake transcriptional regulator